MSPALASSVARAFGLDVRTSLPLTVGCCPRWAKQAVFVKLIPGRQQQVTVEEMFWLAMALHDQTPSQYPFEYALQAQLGEVLYRQFGQRLSKGSVSHLLWVLGLSAQRPPYRAWQQDAVWVGT